MEVGTWRDGLRPVARVALKVVLAVLGLVGSFAGYYIGETYLFPRNDTAQMICAAVGLAIVVVAGWPIVRWVAKFL